MPTTRWRKVDIFRLPFDKVLYLDADTFVFGKRFELLQLLNGKLEPGKIKMVRDVNGKSYNSGVMVFSPNLEAFRKVQSVMATGQLDQPSINLAYEGNVTELPARYNVHGWGRHNCTDAVIAHFTGLHKPTEADKGVMQLMRGGALEIKFGLACPNLYKEFFNELHRQSEFLSPNLRQVLSQPDLGVIPVGKRNPPPRPRPPAAVAARPRGLRKAKEV